MHACVKVLFFSVIFLVQYTGLQVPGHDGEPHLRGLPGDEMYDQDQAEDSCMQQLHVLFIQ